MHEQNTAVAAPRRGPCREVAQKAPTPITLALMEDTAREYHARGHKAGFVEFAARRLHMTRGSVERLLVGCFVDKSARYAALKVALMGALAEAERAGRQIWEDVA